ncbi:MAG: hypothetical protein K9N57_00115 [Candidatus Marinimicrobia bacterium]|nr:hypothetical protein [Candidatus Neomarinimicrobiota bacterium]
MMIYLALAFLLACATSLVLTPLSMHLASITGAIDQPNDRKIHGNPIPRLGGIAVVASSLGILGLFLLVSPLNIELDYIKIFNGVPLLTGVLLIVVVGIWDDHKDISPGIKFAGQGIAAMLICLAGIRIEYITNPFSQEVMQLGLFSYPLTVLWIIGITNAFNLIDGLDGLAAGVAIISLFTITGISLISNNQGIAMMAVILAGSLLGFLRYNFHPAKTFLGDSGSLFIGFTLAVISVQSYTKVSATFAFVVPLLALGLPITDTLVAMARRYLNWFLPHRNSEQGNQQASPTIGKVLSSLFKPDASHIHHRLLSQGISQQNAVLLLYLISGIFGAGAVVVVEAPAEMTFMVLVTIAVLALFFIRQLRYREMEVLKNGILFSMYEKFFVRNGTTQFLLDFFFAFLAMNISLSLTGQTLHIQLTDNWYVIGTAKVGGFLWVQMAVFALLGLYREPVTRIGIAEMLRFTKTLTVTALLGFGYLYLFPAFRAWVTPTFMLLYFYLLTSMVLGIRVAFHALRYYFNRHKDGQKSVLIYGATDTGILTLQNLLTQLNDTYKPIGFLDDDPNLEGTTVNGFPVFGGHWKLSGLLQKRPVDHILITDQNILPEALKRIQKRAEEHDVALSKATFALENLNQKPERYSKPKRELTYASS